MKWDYIQTPSDNKERAWEVAVNPERFSKKHRISLFKRGIKHYRVDGTLQNGDLLKDTATFIKHGFKHKSKHEITRSPPEILNYPGKMAVHMALGSVLVRRHPEVKNDPRNPCIHKPIRRRYLNLLYVASEQGEMREVVLRALGKVVYSRDMEDDYGPPPGRPVEGVTKLEGSDGGLYYQVPLAHANRNCEARQGDDGPLAVLIHGPYVFIPVWDAYPKYEEYFTGPCGMASYIEEVVEKSLSDERLSAYQESLTGANERISELIRTGNEHRIFEERRYPAKLEVMLRAVDHVNADIAKVGEELSAAEIYNATQYLMADTEEEWVRKICEELSGGRAVGTLLTMYANRESIQHVTLVDDPNLDTYRYVLEYTVGSATQVDV